MREGSSAFLPITVTFQSWLSHLGSICCQFEEMQVHCSDFWDMAVNRCGPGIRQFLSPAYSWEKGKKMRDMKFLACFRPWLCKLAGIWRSGTVSWFSRLCCSLWNTSELSSVGEVGDGHSLSLIRPVLPAAIVALPSAIWWTLLAKALCALILLSTADCRLTCPYPHLAVELLTVNTLSSCLPRWGDL